MAEFVLLLRDNGFPRNTSPEEIQAIIARYRAWREKVNAQGKKLTDGVGRVMTKAGGVTDGPFVESKEVMGGFFIIEAKDFDEAVRLSQDCPHLDFGSIEIRQIDRIPS